MSEKLLAKSFLFEAQRRAKSQYKHQRDFAQWLLNAASNRTRIAIAQHIESKRPKRPVGQMEMFGGFYS
jgi:hypothetical protein